MMSAMQATVVAASIGVPSQELQLVEYGLGQYTVRTVDITGERREIEDYETWLEERRERGEMRNWYEWHR